MRGVSARYAATTRTTGRQPPASAEFSAWGVVSIRGEVLHESGQQPVDDLSLAVGPVLTRQTKVLLLFGIARRASALPRLKARYGNRATVLAFFIAALWAVHPLETQAVTYIYQRIEAMMGMFALASLYCFVRGIQTSAEF